MNQQLFSCSCQLPFAAFLAFLMLALLSIFLALSCFALLRIVSPDQYCLPFLGWLLCHQVGPGSLRSSFHGTVLPCSSQNVCETIIPTSLSGSSRLSQEAHHDVSIATFHSEQKKHIACPCVVSLICYYMYTGSNAHVSSLIIPSTTAHAMR
jgi:hypothetical protein